VAKKPVKQSARELAKEASREALLAAGAAEFAERGIDAPSLDDIGARAGFTRGAFYVHFKDREDFLIAVMERTTNAFLDAITGDAESPRDLLGIVRTFASAILSGQAAIGGRGELRLAQLLEACSRSRVVQRRYAAILGEAQKRLAVAAGEGQKANALRRDIRPETIGSLLITTVLGIQVLHETGIDFDIAEGARSILAMLGPSIDDRPARKPRASATKTKTPRVAKRRPT